MTHIPAQPVVYDESASDWEVKLEKIEDVLPHIRRDILVESLKQAGGDEQRAIGLAVIRSRQGYCEDVGIPGFERIFVFSMAFRMFI